ncbi:formin-like [Vanacampus margaritifer]
MTYDLEGETGNHSEEKKDQFNRGENGDDKITAASVVGHLEINQPDHLSTNFIHFENEEFALNRVPKAKRLLITVTRTEHPVEDEGSKVEQQSNRSPSPASPADNQAHLPRLFSDLRVLKKNTVGPVTRDTVAQIQPSTQDVQTTILPETKIQGNFLDQISLLLNPNRRTDELEEKLELLAQAGTKENVTESSPELQMDDLRPQEDALAKAPVSGAEAAFHAFKAFFTPRPLKREKTDQDAVKKRTWTEKDALKAFFERTSNKTSERNTAATV